MTFKVRFSMDRLIRGAKYIGIIVYIFTITFFISNHVYAFNRISPLGSYIDDSPPAIKIEDFLRAKKKKDRYTQMRNAISRQIDYDSLKSRDERLKDRRFIQYQINQAEATNDTFTVKRGKGTNGDGTEWRSYSGKSTKQIKAILDLEGLSKYYSEISKLFPKEHLREWSLILNRQLGEEKTAKAKVEFKLILNNENGLSQSTFEVVKEKIFSDQVTEEERKDGQTGVGQESENKLGFKDGEKEVVNEENNVEDTEEIQQEGGFQWVRKKIIRTDIKHKTGSKGYAINNGPDSTNAYNLITGFHERTTFLDQNDNRVIDRYVEREFHNEKGKRVITNEETVTYEYNSSTFDEEPDFSKAEVREKTHMTKVTREISPDDYVKSSEGEWMVGRYKVKIVDNRSPEKITTREEKLSYDEETDNIIEKISIVHEKSSPDASSELDIRYGIIQKNFSYIPLDEKEDLSQARKYASIKVDGNFDSSQEVLEAAEEINKLKLNEITPDKLSGNITKVRIQDYNNIKYNLLGEQSYLEGNVKMVGKDGEIELDRSYDFEHEILKRDNMRRIKKETEKITNDTSAPNKTVITKTPENEYIEYNLKGQRTSYSQIMIEKAPGLDRTTKTERKNIHYNELGQMDSCKEINYNNYLQ